ncbi:11576_t:CDS:2, partial [Entrophospora sp. SA101]
MQGNNNSNVSSSSKNKNNNKNDIDEIYNVNNESIIDDDDYKTYNDVEDDTIDDKNNDVNIIDIEDEDNTKCYGVIDKWQKDVVKMAVLNLEDKLFLENPYLEIKSKFQLILENLIKNNQINENILSHINKLSKINNVDHGFEIISELSAKNYQSLDDIDSIMMTFVQKKIENMLRFFKASSTFWEKDHSESFKTGLIFLPMMFNLFYGKYNIKTSKDLELVITENGKKQPIEDIRKEKSDTVKLCGELQYMINLIYKKLEIEKQPRFMNKFKEFKVFGLIKS